MKKIAIAKTKKKDIPYIEEKLQKYLLDSTDIDWQQFFVVRQGDKPVGFGRIIDKKEYFEIASLGVDYCLRKQGIGSKLLLFLIGEAKKQESEKPIYIVTHVPDFFKRHGFEETPVYPEYLGYKRSHKCVLDESRIHIMRYMK